MVNNVSEQVFSDPLGFGRPMISSRRRGKSWNARHEVFPQPVLNHFW